MSCEKLRSLWDTFLDGELPTRQMLEMQVHLDGCSECSEVVAFSQAIRVSARQVVYDDALVSDEFRARLRDALHAEAERENAERRVRRLRQLLGNAPKMGLAVLSLAAGVALFVSLGGNPTRESRVALGSGVEKGPAGSRSEREPVVSAALGPEELLDLFIDYHTAPPTPAVTEPKLVPELERDVGVKVPLPSLAAYGAEWQGGSLVRVPRTQPAAYLRYRTRDAHSVTVYVYNASRIPLHASLRPRMIREEPVYERSWRGYSVAAQLRHGVGYAVATDLDETRSAELVRAITKSAVSH
jgi:anti-sigma factor RsiW